MMPTIMRTALLALAMASAQAWGQAPADGGIQVKAQKNGDLVTVDCSLTIAATPQEVWDVLVGFDHMTSFLHGRESSRVAAKEGDVWRVEQKGSVTHAGFTFKFESVRE